MENLFNIIVQHLPSDISATKLRMPFPSRGFFKRFWNIIWVCFHRGAVNHVTGEVHYIVMALPGRRTVLTIHDCGSVIGKVRSLKYWLYKYIWFVWPIRRARIVTVISEKTKRDVMEMTNCPEEKIVVIPNCIDPRFVPKEKVFNTAKPRLLQIGFMHNKNIPRLAAALNGIPCHLHIVGKPDEETIKALKENRIEYTHNYNLSFDEMLEEYHKSDIVTFASVQEGFGVPILEAQAVGRVLITSNISPMKEVSGGAAMLVDPFDVSSIRNGILEVINNEVLRKDLIRRGFENVARYSPTSIAEQYAKLYRMIESER